METSANVVFVGNVIIRVLAMWSINQKNKLKNWLNGLQNQLLILISLYWKCITYREEKKRLNNCFRKTFADCGRKSNSAG